MKKFTIELPARSMMKLDLISEQMQQSTNLVIENSIDVYWSHMLNEIKLDDPAKTDWMAKKYQAYISETQGETQLKAIKSAIVYFDQGGGRSGS